MDNQLESVGGVKDVFTELCRRPGQLDIQLCQARFAFRVEVGAAALELVDRLGEEAGACAGERLGFGGLGQRLDLFPEALIERDLGVKLTDLRLDGVVGLAKNRVGGDSLQVSDHAHRELEALGHIFERQKSILERSGCGVGGEPVQPLLCIGQKFVDRGLDLLGLDLIKRDLELDLEKGVRCGRNSHTDSEFVSLAGHV